jgi:hypothetical protein
MKQAEGDLAGGTVGWTEFVVEYTSEILSTTNIENFALVLTSNRREVELYKSTTT